MPLKKDQDLKVSRAKLWLCCVIVSIRYVSFACESIYTTNLTRTSCAEGIPPVAESFFDGDERDREDTVPFVPPDLQFLHKVYIILLRAQVAMGKTNLQSIDCDVRVLRSLISIFDSELLSLAPNAPSPLGMLMLSITLVRTNIR